MARSSQPPALFLASSSPRRRALLAQIGIDPDAVVAPDIDETPHQAELPRHYATRMAAAKAEAVKPEIEGALVLASDTTVACGRRILAPADDEAAARAALALLSGRRHKVYSAVALALPGGGLRERMSVSTVAFKRLSKADIDGYLASGEWRGKAGGYAIQGRAGRFVRFLSGSYSGVVGLPLFETCQLLEGAGYHVA